MTRSTIRLLLFIIVPYAFADAADLRFAKIFTDHCVLQREMSVPVWGWTEPGSRVTVEFAGQRKAATADGNGKWLIRLDPMKASRQSRELTVSSAGQSLTLKDVLVGEVWLCSGQSNMGLAISKAKGGKEAVAKSDLPHFRMFRVKQNPMYEPGTDVEGDWFVCSPKAFEGGRDFSAVGFFFGQKLLESQDCPIGLIGSYVGGSPLEAWMSEVALESFPSRPGRQTETRKRLDAFYRARDGMTKAMAGHPPRLAAWESELAARNEAHREDLAAWREAVRKAREANEPLPDRPKPAALSRRPLEPNRYPRHATVLFRGMIEPLIPYGIRGTIWYQGEANCYPRLAAEYATSFPLMIKDWRQRWGQGEFPFLFVQLPNLEKGREDWMTLRESQRLAAVHVPNTAMAVTIDVGDPNDLHPIDKKPVADRLALLACAEVYGEEVVASGPLIESAKQMEDGRVQLTFSPAEVGLQGGATGVEKLGGFEVAGRDGAFAPAQATIDGANVLIWAEGTEIHDVRYGWAPNPIPSANLYNRSGLPASPFLIKVEPLAASDARGKSVSPSKAKPHGIERIWLGHRSHDTGKLVVNWMTKEPGDSVVRFGRTANHGQELRVSNNSTIHHVEIPLEEKGGVYHYSVHTGNQSSEDAVFKAYPNDELRVAVAADWQRLPDLSAIRKDDVHLLLTAGDNIPNLHQLCGAGDKECIKPYARLIDRYPELFRSVPFMPALGNHDKQIRPRGSQPPEQPVYDINATAFRRFFELPGDEWKWHFDVPDFDVRFTALDLHHISDMGTTWQTCHSFGKDSGQFRWYDMLMGGSAQKFVVTLYNERNGSIRGREKGAWHSMFRKGTIAITGFGYYAERAEVDGFTYYNTSLSGTGNRYPDPKSAFLKGADSYILLTLTRNPAKMVVEIKGLDGAVLDRKVYQ